jgi:hypothetical protein
MTFDHVRLDEANLHDCIPEIETNTGRPGAANPESGMLGSLSG